MIALFLASAAPAADSDIVITASRAPQEKSQTAASVSVIDEEKVDRLGDPLVPALVRLTPSAAVETGGSAGALTQVRIRGAEANHTLLFIDGIRANDPAAGDIPRFELLNADIVSRIEVVRGPQSALWGSDAIGGVVAINGVATDTRHFSAVAEGGSFGFGRAFAAASQPFSSGSLAAAVGWQSATGIDTFDGEGDKDGYRNLSARILGSWMLAPRVKAGLAAFSLSGRSEFDGLDPVTFVRADTLNSSRNRLSAGRLWLSAGDPADGWSGTIGSSLLDSANRNFLGDEQINRTSGRRWTASAQVQHHFATGSAAHTAILVLDHDRESFDARDTIYGGASNQHRHRSHQAVTAEWRTDIDPVTLDVAVRRDSFSAFKNSTTVRASALAKVAPGISVSGSYSEGIAQPSFFDLYGFFPGSFIGNPALKAEKSRGFEASLRYRGRSLEAALTGYRQRLEDEIVDVFDPSTFLSSTENRASASHRSGLEAELGWAAASWMRLSVNYAFLDATQPGPSLAGAVREVRRPRHSGSVAADGVLGRLTYGASLAYVGSRRDMDFDSFPALPVRLKPYWLANAKLAYRVGSNLRLYARVSNLLAESYQDVFGYRTEGRAVFAGIELGAR